MKVLFLPQTSELGPSSRYRVYQLVPFLQQLGIECEVSPAIDSDMYRRIYLSGDRNARFPAWRQTWKHRRADLPRLAEFDVVFVQKAVFPGLYSGFEQKLSRQKPLVVDFDDAIWLPRKGGSQLLRALHREQEVQKVLQCASAVIAGNEFLAEYARRFNREVTVIPSAIDLDRYPRPKPVASGSSQPVIGWIGSRTTLPYLTPLGPVFQELGVVPRIIASGDPSSLGFPTEFRPWDLQSELHELAQLDIGIAPLSDNPWEHGKCGVKLLQYMACGIPVVASPVGVHKTIVRHGENGFLATTERQWIESLRALMADEQLRLRFGREARATVEKQFDVRTAAEKVASILKGLYA